MNVYCNVHPNMSAVIHVLASPYFTFADANGNFSFADVPPGHYEAVAWNEMGGCRGRRRRRRRGAHRWR